MKRYWWTFLLLIMIYLLPPLAILSNADGLVGVKEDTKSVLKPKTELSVTTPEKKVLSVKKPAVVPKKIAYLTFDDGPNKTVTPKVLSVLKENNIKATFFMLGCYIDANPSVAKSVYENGHVIGNHSYTHKWSILRTEKGFENEIAKTNKSIKKITGYSPWLFRIPYDYKISKASKSFLKANGMRIFRWNIDAKDTRGKKVPAQKIYNNVAWALNNKKDIVIIMHDSAGHEQTAIALKKIIPLLKKKGYEFRPLTKGVKVDAKVEIY